MNRLRIFSIRFLALKGFLLFLAVVSAGATADAQINTDQVVQIGRNALYFEDYMLSIQYFNQAIAAKPYLAKAYLYRAIAKLNLEDYRGAEEDASQALTLNPYLSDAWEVRGVARQNLGKDSEAISDYDEALKLLPHNRSLLFNKALAQSQIKDFTGAEATFGELTRYYPGFDNAYLGRARLRLEQKDTVAARADIDKALELNHNALNAYILRADIAISSKSDYESAEKDIDQAIKLRPHTAGLYINRAFLRYNQDNYKGAMADYDYALSLEPLNATALFNRGLLLTEVSANDLALEDFNRVLSLNPDDYRALFNRAIIHEAKGNTAEAIADITRVHEAFPDFPGALYLRARLHKARGELKAAERDYNAATAASKNLKPGMYEEYADMSPSQGQTESRTGNKEPSNTGASDSKESDAATARRFASLLTVDNTSDLREEYNNTAIRGRVQDRNQTIELEPMMILSYYNSPTELRSGTYYIKEVDDLNATRALHFVIVVTNRVPTLDESTVARHFQSIDYYNSYLAEHRPRAADYFGRAMDFLTVRDYISAEKDIERGIALMPDFAPAYLMRAQARYDRLATEGEHTSDIPGMDASMRAGLRMKALDDIASDLNETLRLSPEMAVAWFNKGNIEFERGNADEALRAYSKAIEIKPEFGEAYYNRGYIELRNGRRSEGITDLSRAGELGIVQAYNLIKRLSN